ncbi:MAG: Gfo/Idh/MocA family oxidoreductase [Bacteroidia bacterium]|nr:Gfo/Idh/MocA family oxidoreductase [Bacteroidia bacterium]
MKGLKAGFIGCGKIAHFHADVFNSLGINIDSLCYRSNKENAQEFAKKYHISKIFTNWKELIAKSKIDFLWVIPGWDQIDLIFEEIIETGIPAFFEKPIAIDPVKTSRIINKYSSDHLKRYQVGYNRRFYEIIDYLREILSNEKIISISVDIPETVKGLNEKLIKYRLIQNSSHVFDLIFYLIDCFEPTEKNFIPIATDSFRNDFMGFFKINGIPVNINSVWNAPENHSVKIYTESENIFKLCPLEELTIYKGFTIIEPTREKPARQYKPQIINNIQETGLDGFKPGFKKQAEEFTNSTINGAPGHVVPTLQQSALMLAFLTEIYSDLRR